eukprot:9151263-Pyramimonas_sp.AAC.1
MPVALSTQSAWKYKDGGPEIPEFRLAEAKVGVDNLVAQWADGVIWEVPDTDAIATEKKKSPSLYWKGNGKDDDEISVKLVKKKTESWVTIWQNTAHILQFGGWKEGKFADAKAPVVSLGQKFAKGEVGKPGMELEKFKWL